MTRSIRGIGGVTTGHAEARKEFRNILFDFDSDRIKRSSYPQLGEIGMALGMVMADHPDYRFSIEGHTDSIGDHD
jgi:outer membrane protein OmpA-like peptidoglycan-associated protein